MPAYRARRAPAWARCAAAREAANPGVRAGPRGRDHIGHVSHVSRRRTATAGRRRCPPWSSCAEVGSCRDPLPGTGGSAASAVLLIVPAVIHRRHLDRAGRALKEEVLPVGGVQVLLPQPGCGRVRRGRADRLVVVPGVLRVRRDNDLQVLDDRLDLGGEQVVPPDQDRGLAGLHGRRGALDRHEVAGLLEALEVGSRRGRCWRASRRWPAPPRTRRRTRTRSGSGCRRSRPGSCSRR